MNDLDKVLELDQLEQSRAEILKNEFSPVLNRILDLVEHGKKIKVTDASQLDIILDARHTRLALTDVKQLIEKRRKVLKAPVTEEGKAIDKIANAFKNVIVPVEKHLKEQENFEKIQKEKEQAKNETFEIQLINAPNKEQVARAENVVVVHDSNDESILQKEETKLTQTDVFAFLAEVITSYDGVYVDDTLVSWESLGASFLSDFWKLYRSTGYGTCG
jgi:hypothetical protein